MSQSIGGLQDRINAALAGLPEKEVVYLCVATLSGGESRFAGFQENEPVYPASLYKLYVAMAVLHEIRHGRLKPSDRVVVRKHNVANERKEIFRDPYPKLKAGNKRSVAALLALMITRSDNTAANELIDIVGRVKINMLVCRYGWRGSEVTRKFLPRDREDESYKKARATVTTARHLAEFLVRVEQGRLVSPAHSYILKEMLGWQLDGTKIRRGLPRDARFYHKTGWFVMRQGRKSAGVSGDCGIVETDDSLYVVSCIVVVPGRRGERLLAKIGRRLHAQM